MVRFSSFWFPATRLRYFFARGELAVRGFPQKGSDVSHNIEITAHLLSNDLEANARRLQLGDAIPNRPPMER